MPDYRIEKVSTNPPREWDNPRGGKVYYINVMLEGHPKPVAIGKKAPDALKAGMTVSGDILPDPEHGEDKWKSAPMGQGNFGGGGFNQTSSVGGVIAKKEWQPKDEDAIKAMWAIGQSVQLLKEGTSKTPSNQAIELWADTFFEMVNRVKTGQRAMEAPRTVVPAPIEDSDAEAISLYQSIAGAENGITTDSLTDPDAF